MKNSLLIIVLFIVGLSSNGQAQENEWLVKPIISDMISRVVPELRLIEVFNEEKLKGVRDFDNEVIIPITHTHISIFNQGNYIAANKESKKFYYDHEGYEVDESRSDDARKASRRHKNKMNTEFKEQFNSENHNFQLHDFIKEKSDGGPHSLFLSVLTQSGDTLINQTLPDRIKIIDENHLLHKNGKAIYNKDGKKIYTAESSHFSAYEKNGYLIVEDQRKRKLFDKEFNQIGEDYESLHTYEGLPHYAYGVSRDSKELFLSDNKGNDDLIGKPVEWIQQIMGSDIFYFRTKEKTGTYNIATGDIIDYDFAHYKIIKDSPFKIVKKDTMYGAFDLLNNKMIVPIAYPSVKYQAPYFIATDRKSSWKKAPKVFTLYDQNGLEIFSERLSQFYIMNNGCYIKKDIDGISTLFNHDGSEIMVSKDGQKITPAGHRSWVKIEEEKSKKCYLIPELINGNRVSFDKIGKEIRASRNGDQALILVYGEKGKLGAVNKDFELVIPVKYEKIEEMSIDGIQYLKVKYKGKYGIMKRT